MCNSFVTHPQLSTGSNVELPLWIIPELAVRNMVRVKLKKCFGERTKRELEAGASKVRPNLDLGP